MLHLVPGCQGAELHYAFLRERYYHQSDGDDDYGEGILLSEAVIIDSRYHGADSSIEQGDEAGRKQFFVI
jgi:hypothetical protein